MSTRDVRVRLRAEVQDFKRQMAEAGKATESTAAQFDRSGQKIQTTSGRIVRSAEVNREAWTTTGTALAGVAVAFGALGVAIGRTGIEYNTLQQTSRAALTTLLDGAEQANAQMDKLDDFARNSPFAKQVFIQAQQQMLGFGIETQKVLPYLDSIQNAVAAMGGSNNDISELSRIISQISASAKITATDLREFGNRGIDAATIIGSQMDMTGAEIRESITAGTLDAQEALDALAAGMDERFGGAAENVKNTYAGALDRVKAAWRDMAAEITAPLVDPDGGGLLVDLANDAADAMRAFEALPTPVKNTVVALGGLTGTAAGVGAAFLLLAPRIIDTRVAMAQLQNDMPRTAAAMGRMATMAGIVTAAMAGSAAATTLYAKSVEDALASSEAASALLDIADGATAAETALGNLSDVSTFDRFFAGNNVDGLERAFQVLNDPNIGDQIRNFGGSITSFGQSTSSARLSAEAMFESIDAGLTELVATGQTDRAAQALAGVASEAGVSVSELTAMLPGYRNALAGVDNEQRASAESAEALAAGEERLADVQERETAAQEKLTAAREAYREEVDRWRGVMTDAFTSFVDNTGAFDAAVQKQTEWAQAQAAATESAEDSWKDYFDGSTISAQSYADVLREQVEAQQEWADNVTTVSDRLKDSFSGEELENARAQLDELAGQGSAGAGVLATLADATDAELAEIVSLWAQGGEDAGRDFVDEFMRSSDPFIEPKLDMELAQITLDQWARQVVTLEAQIEPTSTSNGGLFNDWLQSNIGALQGSITGASLGAFGGRFAGGGRISGPGTSTSDSIPIMASDGEFMVKAAAVDFWGQRAMESVNNNDVAGLWREMAARGFRDGGSISAPAPQVVTVPVTQRYESHAPVQITAYGSDLPSMEAEAERRRLSVLGGR